MPTLLGRTSDPLVSSRPLHMSEEEFEAWATSEVRAEFVDGEVIEMSPVLVIHAEVQQFLNRLLGSYLEETGQGRLLVSDVTARLRSGLRRVPDLLYVSAEHADRITPRYIEGPPDAVFEIVSADSVVRDWRDKFSEYEEAGVGEYWIIDPAHQLLQVSSLVDGRFADILPADGWVESHIIKGFKLRPEWLWKIPSPKVRDCLHEIGVEY